MTEHAILVVDAERETEEKIVLALEAEGYLVFTASGREISTGMGARVSPSLIYLRPTARSVEGFATCKAIHNSESFKNVPIILLASVRGPLDSRYATYYGIVDYLKMPFSSEELIEKTEKILGIKSRDLREPGEDIGFIDEGSAPEEEAGLTRQEHAPDSEIDDISEIGQPNEAYSYRDEAESLKESFLNRGQERRPEKAGLMFTVLAGIAAIAIVVAAGFLLYTLFFSPTDVYVPVTISSTGAVQQPEPLVLPPMEEQRQKQTAAEADPAEIKETLKKVPATALEAIPVLKPVHSVQVGAFKSENSAEVLVKTYKGKGYEAFTEKGRAKNKETIYRVLIGKYESRKEAIQLANQIQTREKVKTTVFGEGLNMEL